MKDANLPTFCTFCQKSVVKNHGLAKGEPSLAPWPPKYATGCPQHNHPPGHNSICHKLLYWQS